MLLDRALGAVRSPQGVQESKRLFYGIPFTHPQQFLCTDTTLDILREHIVES